MLSAVMLRPSVVSLAAVLAVAACTTSTAGSGSVGAPAVGNSSSSPDFPSASSAAPASSGAAAPSSASASASPTVHPAPATPLRTATVHASDATYVVKVWADVKDDTCFDHAHGTPIVNFLTQHPCTGLHRMLATTTVKGRPVGMAISETGFQGPASDPYKYASAFIKLEQQDGTGSIDDLLMDGYRLPQGPTAIPAGEAFNVVGQDEGVTVWDAWYLDGPTPTNAKPLMQMTLDLFLQF